MMLVVFIVVFMCMSCLFILLEGLFSIIRCGLIEWIMFGFLILVVMKSMLLIRWFSVIVFDSVLFGFMVLMVWLLKCLFFWWKYYYGMLLLVGIIIVFLFIMGVIWGSRVDMF